MSRHVNLTDRALMDIEETLLRSEVEFGERASRRYEQLLSRAIQGLAEADPSDSQVLGLPDGVLARHLGRYRRDEEGQIGVKNPRHYLVFRLCNGEVEVLRVLPDAADLSRLIISASEEPD
jgi:plasmid stabilization system protein ParE